MKKIIYFLLSFLYIFKVQNIFASETDIIPDFRSIFSFWWWSGTWMIDRLVNAFISNIFSLLALVVITIFIYIWFLFITSSWDPAQFKKAWKIFMYTIIWMVVIVLSLGVVRLITSIWI